MDPCLGGARCLKCWGFGALFERCLSAACFGFFGESKRQGVVSGRGVEPGSNGLVDLGLRGLGVGLGLVWGELRVGIGFRVGLSSASGPFSRCSLACNTWWAVLSLASWHARLWPADAVSRHFDRFPPAGSLPCRPPYCLEIGEFQKWRLLLWLLSKPPEKGTRKNQHTRS